MRTFQIFVSVIKYTKNCFSARVKSFIDKKYIKINFTFITLLSCFEDHYFVFKNNVSCLSHKT